MNYDVWVWEMWRCGCGDVKMWRCGDEMWRCGDISEGSGEEGQD